MLIGFEDSSGYKVPSKKDLLIREAEEAFSRDDKASCADAINRLYEMFDELLGGFRRRRSRVAR